MVFILNWITIIITCMLNKKYYFINNYLYNIKLYIIKNRKKQYSYIKTTNKDYVIIITLKYDANGYIIRLMY